MKKLLFLLLLFGMITFFYGQKNIQIFNRPSIHFQSNNSVSISNVKILNKTIEVNLEYIDNCNCVYELSNIGVNSKIHIEKDGETIAKLISVKNISLLPKTTKTIVNKTLKFSLVFTKPLNLNEGDIIDIVDDSSINSFRFYGINLKNNNENPENFVVKNNFFLKYIPISLHVLFYNDIFFSSNKDLKELFDSLIEAINDNKIKTISKISKETIYDNNNEELIAYTVMPNLNSENVLSSYYFSKDNSNTPNYIKLYFTDKTKIESFYESIINWTGATKKSNSTALAVKFRKNKMYFITFSITKVSEGVNTIDIGITQK